jgi:hypothetical protein
MTSSSAVLSVRTSVSPGALWLPCLLLVGLLVDGGLVAYGLRARLTAAAEGLQAGGAQLATGNPDQAQREFADALDSARSAGDLTGRPSFVLASLVPWLGANSIAVEALTGAADLSAQAGHSAVDARREIGSDVTTSLYRDAQVRFRLIGGSAAASRRGRALALGCSLHR